MEVLINKIAFIHELAKKRVYEVRQYIHAFMKSFGDVQMG